MAEGYVTLGEAAELEGIQYKTMSKRIDRNPEKFLITKEQREKGGKELPERFPGEKAGGACRGEWLYQRKSGRGAARTAGVVTIKFVTNIEKKGKDGRKWKH